MNNTDPYLLRGDVRDAMPPKPIRVSCDGTELPFCFAFDVEQGWAMVYVTDPAGCVVPNEGNAELLAETRTGRIEAVYADAGANND
jgi:hypothetical protein